MLEDNTPHSFITELMHIAGFNIVRDRKLVEYGKWLIKGLTKPKLTNLAKMLSNSKIKYEIKKSKTYGDVFSFDYSNVSYNINCKTKILTVYFNEAKIR